MDVYEDFIQETNSNALMEESLDDREIVNDYSLTDVDTSTSIPATSPTSYLGNQNLFCCNKQFFFSIQDRGESNIDRKTGLNYE